MTATRPWIAVGAIAALLAVAMGAFAAHGLEATGDARAVDLVDKAARYQMIHALGLILCGLVGQGTPPAGRGWVRAAGVAFGLGIVLFCGTLYTLAFTPWPVALAAPFGGTAFMVGWGCLAVAALRTGGGKPGTTA
ncbi:DUF423 domain-containing protein [Roseospira visakhapatnamensis]|uniref:Uncharacterized membrane protein YgdD (TMEM256/DUF423 family) n=1 Tax=Roseospira visakhapatnamensis TaxID=390880 RepID=A0A7W6WA77_9PROT|nr:DUF423 domain-containing protein [Roseospira visakhapatnamensis]MBB4266568.1 uncharacterized membrane protein YgdD (TMEM256/DUF423 family) [Roseospira visakhapatnamensis]